MDTFSARDASFSSVIREFRPKVPQLQRNYSWGPSQWKDLWDDLVGFYEDYGTADRPYFIGTVVLVSADKGTEILDGQQRLATLTVFLSAIVHSLKSKDAKYAAIFDENGVQESKDDDVTLPYITMNMYDGNFFRKYVQDREFDTAAEIESHKLIKKAMIFFIEQIEIYSKNTELDAAAWLRKMGRIILDRVRFAYVKSDPSDSYQVFRVLNDRGRGLSQLDLFRTFLLQKAGEKAAEEIAKNWTHILDIEAPGSPDDLLRFYWITQRGDIKSQRLFRDIKQVVDSGEKPATELADELFFYSEIYKELVAASGTTPEESSLYQAIIDVRAKVLYPLLMASKYVIDSGGATQKDYLRLLRLGVNLFIRHTLVCGLENFRLEAVAYKAARTVVQESSLDSALEALRAYGSETVPDSRFGDDFAVCEVRYESAAKALLRAMEQSQYNATEISVPTTKDLHLEHIMPKRPANDEKLSDHDHWLWRLGNLTLLDGTLNRKAGNKKFAAKQAAYQESSLQITKELVSQLNWSPERIVARQKQMSERAKLVWSLDI